MTVRRGQIWTVNVNPTTANEQAGRRPCLVISADLFNALPIRRCIVIPLTTRDRQLPHHIRVKDDGGLTRPSWAMCEAVRSISANRLGDLIGMAESTTIGAVADQVRAWIEPDSPS
jgi:mRNA interferase MazF